MHISILAGFVSSTIFISSNLPMLFKAFKMQQSLAENGTMKISDWN